MCSSGKSCNANSLIWFPMFWRMKYCLLVIIYFFFWISSNVYFELLRSSIVSKKFSTNSSDYNFKNHFWCLFKNTVSQCSSFITSFMLIVAIIIDLSDEIREECNIANIPQMVLHISINEPQNEFSPNSTKWRNEANNITLPHKHQKLSVPALYEYFRTK